MRDGESKLSVAIEAYQMSQKTDDVLFSKDRRDIRIALRHTHFPLISPEFRHVYKHKVPGIV